MYQNSFWDTAAGQQFASVITYDLPKFTDRKHTIERVSLKELPDFLKNILRRGNAILILLKTRMIRHTARSF